MPAIMDHYCKIEPTSKTCVPKDNHLTSFTAAERLIMEIMPLEVRADLVTIPCSKAPKEYSMIKTSRKVQARGLVRRRSGQMQIHLTVRSFDTV